MRQDKKRRNKDVESYIVNVGKYTCAFPISPSIAIVILLCATGCKQNRDATIHHYEPENVAVFFNSVTPQAIVDSIILAGNFEIVSEDTGHRYTLRLPQNMTFSEAETYFGSSNEVLEVKPLCQRTDVFLWGPDICVPKPDSSRTCPEGYSFADCYTGSCRACRDCVPACLPEDMLP